MMAGDFNMPLTIMSTTTRQKISREMGLEPHDKLTRSNRRIQNTSPNTTAHTVLLSAHGTFSRTDYRLGHELSLNRS